MIETVIAPRADRNTARGTMRGRAVDGMDATYRAGVTLPGPGVVPGNAQFGVMRLCKDVFDGACA